MKKPRPKTVQCGTCKQWFASQGIAPHQRSMNHEGRLMVSEQAARAREGESIDRPLPALPAPITRRTKVNQDDLPIVVIKNMEVVRRGDRIGIVEWHDHDG